MNKAPKIFVLVDDLFFGVKVADAAKRLGVPSESIKTPEQLLASLEGVAGLVIIDLSMRRIDPVRLIAEIKGRPAGDPALIVAFLPHVQTELMRQAEEAGCDLVVPRSAFARDLDKILSESLASLSSGSAS